MQREPREAEMAWAERACEFGLERRRGARGNLVLDRRVQARLVLILRRKQASKVFGQVGSQRSMAGLTILSAVPPPSVITPASRAGIGGEWRAAAASLSRTSSSHEGGSA